MSELIAEARVLVTPDTTAFRAQLTAQLAAATKGIVVPIPVTAVAARGSAAGATGALSDQAAAAEAAGAATANLSATQIEAIQINKAFAATEAAVAEAQLEVVGAANAQEAAEIALQRQTAAGVAARKLLTAAQLQGLDVQRLLQNETVRTAVAMGAEAAASEREAAAHLSAAAAAEKHAVALRGVGRGSATAALGAVGLRGATLAASAPFIAGAAAAIVFAKSIASFADFETSLNVFAATTGATAEQITAVSDAAKELGSDLTLPGVTAQSAADAMLQLAKAGLSVQDSIDGARGVLQLATAASLDNATATTIAASAINAFGLAGRDAVHVADVLANAANLSQGSIEDVGLSLQQTAAVARQVGVSFEDTVSLLTELQKAGIRGSDAGTSLRVAFIRLINPTEKARKILEGLNIQVRDLQGNVRPQVFSDFANAQKNLTKAQQDSNAATVFGTDALRTYAIEARAGTGGLNTTRKALDQQGTAAEQATAKTKGTAGAIENLKNQAAALGLNIGDALSTPTKDFLDIFAGGLENINSGLALLNQNAAATKPTLAELATEAGKINFAVASRQFGGDVSGNTAILDEFNRVNDEVTAAAGKASPALLREQQQLAALVEAGKPVAGQGLLDEQTKLNKALEDSLGPGVAATATVEGYRDALHNASLEAEGLRNRIDENTDRFAQPIEIPQPVAAQGPTPIGPTAKLNRREALAQAEGNFPLVLEIQKEALARAQAAAAASQGNVTQRTKLFNKVTAAEAAVATTQRQITEAAAAKIKSDAAAAKAAQQKADQAVLDAFAPAQSRLNIQEITANATAQLQDNVALQDAVIAEAKREVQVITNTVKNVQTRNTELAKQAAVIKTAQTTRAALLKQIADDALGARVDFAQSVLTRTGRLSPLLNALQAQITEAIQTRDAAKKGTVEWLRAQTAVNGLIEQRKQAREKAQDDLVQSQLALGQSIADLTDNQTPLLRALNFAIKEATDDRNAAKKGSVAWNQAQAAINDFLKQRKDALNPDTSGTDAGTTLVDLFKETQAIADAAGNVGRIPGGLTSSAANAPIRDLVQQRLDIQLSNPKGESLVASQQNTTERLITTLDQLIATIGGQGFGVTVGNQGTGGKLAKAVDTAARFSYQRVANSIVEAGVWG